MAVAETVITTHKIKVRTKRKREIVDKFFLFLSSFSTSFCWKGSLHSSTQHGCVDEGHLVLNRGGRSTAQLGSKHTCSTIFIFKKSYINSGLYQPYYNKLMSSRQI